MFINFFNHHWWPANLFLYFITANHLISALNIASIFCFTFITLYIALGIASTTELVAYVVIMQIYIKEYIMFIYLHRIFNLIHRFLISFVFSHCSNIQYIFFTIIFLLIDSHLNDTFHLFHYYSLKLFSIRLSMALDDKYTYTVCI